MEQKIKQDEIFIGRNIRRIRKGDAADGNGNIDAVRECTIDKRSVSEDREGNSTHTDITA